MFKELHRKTVELLSAKTSNYLLEQVDFEADSTNDLSSISSSVQQQQRPFTGRCVYDSIFDVEQNINQIESDERVENLTKCMIKLQILHDQHEKCSASLSDLRDTYAAVAEKTSSLHTACDQMMSQQTQLAAANEQLKTNLYYYQQYEWIMKKLQTSKLSLTGTLFTQILSTIHECILYLKAHSDEKEAQSYLHKYEQCLSKSLTAIKAGVLADLNACREEVYYRQSRHFHQMPSLPADVVVNGSTASNLSSVPSEERNPVSAYVNDDTFALLYGVFGVMANTVRNALCQAHRFFADTAEYETIVSECEAEYFSIREHLLRPIVEATVRALCVRNANSSCNLTRDGCAFLLRLCDDEFRLYKNFFLIGMEESLTGQMTNETHSTGVRSPMSPFSLDSFFWSKPQQTSLPFDVFIESLSTILYDTLRPLIIANPHLETLTQLCTLIKVEMIEERCGRLMPVANSGSWGTAGSSSMTGTTGMSAEFTMNPRAGFARVMGELVGDIVERIVYRTSLFAQTDVLGYNPAPGDLAYPERLLMMNEIKMHQLPIKESTVEDLSVANSPTTQLSSELVSLAINKRGISNTQSSAIDLHCLWYPTVRRTVMCLSKLYKCLDPTVFLNVSSELLEACCQSLQLAAEKICTLSNDSAKASVKLAGRALDAQLFIVKHLLILREQTSPYRSLASKQYRKQQQSSRLSQKRGHLSRSGSVTSLASHSSQIPPSVDSASDFGQQQPQFDYSLDLSRYKNSMFELLSAENRGRWFELSSNNAVLSFLLAAPIQMSEFQTDSRRIIEAHLRRHCHELIRFVTKFLTASLPHIVKKIEEFEQKRENVEKEQNAKKETQQIMGVRQEIRQRTLDFTGYDELAPKALNDITFTAFKNIKQNWPLVCSVFSLYIGSRETEEILLQPNRKAIMQLFSDVAAFTQKCFSHEQRQIASVPGQEQIWLLLNSSTVSQASIKKPD